MSNQIVSRTFSAIVAVFALVGSAKADVVSAGCVYSLLQSGPDVQGRSTCNTFNPLLGTLTEVTVHYSAGVAGSLLDQGSSSIVAQVSGQFIFDPFSFSSSTGQSGIMSSSNSLISAGAIAGPTVNASFDRNLSGILHAFDYFTGAAGQQFSLLEGITGYQLTVMAGPNPYLIESRTGHAEIDINYTYTALAPPPSVVAEPSSIALSVIALAGLGFSRRKRT